MGKPPPFFGPSRPTPQFIKQAVSVVQVLTAYYSFDPQDRPLSLSNKILGGSFDQDG